MKKPPSHIQFQLTLLTLHTCRLMLLCCVTVWSLFIFAGCTQNKEPEPPAAPPSPSFPVTLQVDGESFQIQKKPQKIVSLTPDITEALDNIGASGFVAGVSDYCEEVTGLSLGRPCGTAQAIDMETLTALKPDIVLTSSSVTQNQKKQLALLDLTLIEFSHADSVEQICEKYLNLFLLCFGETSGREQGVKFGENFQKKLSAILSPAKEFSELTQKKTAIYLASLDTTMATGDTFEGYLMEEMGLINLADDASHWVLPQDSIKGLSPDIIFYDTALDGDEIKSNDIYKNSLAVSADNLFCVDFGAITRGNLSMLDQIDFMAQACYPDAFVGNYGSSSSDESTDIPDDKPEPAQDNLTQDAPLKSDSDVTDSPQEDSLPVDPDVDYSAGGEIPVEEDVEEAALE